MCDQKQLPKKDQDKAKGNVHDQEHHMWNRRSFIQALGLAGAGSMMLANAQVTASKPSPLSVALNDSETDRILVIIRLKGGNDGLNTIVPVYDYDNYANLRPTIRHNQADLMMLNADFGVPDYMNSLESIWGEGQMKVIHGVGYPQQNLSHFRSSDIWASTDDINNEQTGWWGRYFEDLYPDYIVNPPEVPPAIQIGSVGNLIFEGSDSNYAFSVANPEQLALVAESGTLHDVLDIPDCVYGDKLLFLRSTANTTFTYAGVINDAYTSAVNSVQYDDAELANQLAICARMIKGGLGTKVYMVTLNGFDTHAEQPEVHQQLLTDLANSIRDFYTDLENIGMQNEVLCMTISEFGRRPYENGSTGTDHGAASPVMLFGPELNGSGFVGQHPDINKWDMNDNLIPSTDFRDVYNSVLTSWFCLDPSVVSTILLDQQYQQLDLGFDCSNLGTTDFIAGNRLVHGGVYRNGVDYIELDMPVTAHLNIKLFDIMGREVGTIANELVFAGRQSFDIRNRIKTRLSLGQYIYRISTGGQFYSKSIMLH